MASLSSKPGAVPGCCATSRSARRNPITRCWSLRVLHPRELDVLDARLEWHCDAIDVAFLIHPERHEAAQRQELRRVIDLEDVVVVMLESSRIIRERQLQHRAGGAHREATIRRM